MHTRTPSERSASSRIISYRAVLLAAAIAFLMTYAGGSAYAYWSLLIRTSGTVSTQHAEVTQDGFSSLAAEYTPSQLSSTQSFTITNSGEVEGDSGVSITAEGPLAEAVSLKIWTVDSSADCLATSHEPESALNGTWASPPALSQRLEAGSAVTYCTRSFISDWHPLATPDGTQSFTAELSATLHAQGWLATTGPTSISQRTLNMYQTNPRFFDPEVSRWFEIRNYLNTNSCLSSLSRLYTPLNGAPLRSYDCKLHADRRWEFVPVNQDDQSLVSIRPRFAPHAWVTEDSRGKLTVSEAFGDPTLSQQWYVFEDTSAASVRYRFMNAVSGSCLNLELDTTPKDLYTLPCESDGANLFLTREPLTFTQQAPYRIGFSATPLYRNVALERWNGGDWERITYAPANAPAITISYIGPAIPQGESLYRIVELDGAILWDGIKIDRSDDTFTPTGGFG